MTCLLIVQSPGPLWRQHNPALVTPRPSKVQDLILSPQSVSNPLRQAAQEAHTRQFKPLALKKSSSSLPLSILKKRGIRKEDVVHAEVSHCSTLHILPYSSASRNEPSIPQDAGSCKESPDLVEDRSSCAHHRHRLRSQ
jgi:hypothetical protein